MSTLALPQVVEYGDSAIMVTVDSPDADLRQRRVVELRDAFTSHRPPGVTDVVSGLESFLVEYDPIRTGPDQLIHSISLISELPPTAGSRNSRVFDLPVCFDDDTAPDLPTVADELGLSAEETISQLVEGEFSIVLLAAAMAPMMSGLSLPAPVSRQRQPRTNVPEGSIMIAGRHAIIQPFPGPTGWRVVGRTPLTIVDIARAAPTAFAPGDILRFTRIDTTEFEGLRGGFLTGTTS
jgi:KipI family sensor histidine kinase inhibitor